MRKKAMIFMLFLLVGSYACQYNKYENIKPYTYVVPCDSAAPVISYSKHIAPIMEYNCGSKNSCHNTAGAGGDIILEDYNGVSYAAATGQLMSCVVWDDATIYMPQNTTTKIDACYIKELQKWVDAGFPNN